VQIDSHSEDGFGSFSIESARRFKSGYVGSASNSDGILCGVANGGQCHFPTWALLAHKRGPQIVWEAYGSRG
jgi:hypothetical protein